MILVDTSVWIDHLRLNDTQMANQLRAGTVLMHPFVLGELGLRHLRQRASILQSMRQLPEATMAANDEVMHFIASQDLAGRGIGYIDAHLLASCRLTPHTQLWTRDKRLSAVAETLSLSAQNLH